MTGIAATGIGPGSVVALDGPAGPEWLAAMDEVWSHGGVISPIDSRLPAAARHAMVATVAPTHVMAVQDRSVTRLPDGVPAEPGDALIMCTSGTTGQPRAVIHTHRSIAASAAATNDWLATTPDDHWMACLPLAHIGGLSVVFRARARASRLTVLPRFDAPTVMAATAGPQPVTRVSLVTRALADVDSSRFTTVLLGGAAPPPDRPANVIATYGMTETGSGVVYNGIPLDGVELRSDAHDQLWVRGPMLMRGYRDGLTPFDSDGWFPTGDLGRFDGTTVSVFGRAGDVIVSGGEKVDPARVEPILTATAGVMAAAVIGRADKRWGQRVVALIELVPGATAPPLEQLRDAVKAELPVWYAPTELEVTKLPRTASGKVRRRDLT